MVHAVAQWLRHWPSNWKVGELIPDSVIRIFHWHNPSGRTTAPGLNQALTEMSLRDIYWGKGGRAVGHHHVPIVLKSGSLNLLEPSGPVEGCNGIALPLPYFAVIFIYGLFSNVTCVWEYDISEMDEICRGPYWEYSGNKYWESNYTTQIDTAALRSKSRSGRLLL
jgi:hypothetical protein